MHAPRSAYSDVGSINVPTEQAKLTRDPLIALYQSRYPDQQPGTTGTGLVTGYHGQRAEAGR
jgi:hypothetical protein